MISMQISKDNEQGGFAFIIAHFNSFSLFFFFFLACASSSFFLSCLCFFFFLSLSLSLYLPLVIILVYFGCLLLLFHYWPCLFFVFTSIFAFVPSHFYRSTSYNTTLHSLSLCLSLNVSVSIF